MKNIFALLSVLISPVGVIVAVGMTLYAVFLSFVIVSDVFSPAVAFISLVIFPVLWGVTPLYALFTYGDWTLIFLSYGAMPIVFISFAISNFFESLGKQ